MEMDEAPKVYCYKYDREVPIWWCLGSYIQRRSPCQELEELKVDGDTATVKCKGKKKDEQKASN